MNMYELYHVESIDNAFADLDRKLGIKRECVAQAT